MVRVKKIVIGSIAVLIVICTVGIAALNAMNKPSAESELDSYLLSVGKHYLLPEDETPTLATIEDIRKIKSDFFRSAKNGDKLLVYSKAKIAILYRPEIDKIIEVGPVSVAPTQGLFGQ